MKMFNVKVGLSNFLFYSFLAMFIFICVIGMAMIFLILGMSVTTTFGWESKVWLWFSGLLGAVFGLALSIYLGSRLDRIFNWRSKTSNQIYQSNISTYYVKLYYICSACGASFSGSDVPPDMLCPLDHIPLHSYDPVEDKNCERL